MADTKMQRRLDLLARIRRIEHRESATKAFSALAQQQRVRALATKALDLSRNYDPRHDLRDGHELIARSVARAQTADLARKTDAQALMAEERAGRLLAAEREVRQRRDRVAEESVRLRRETAREEETRESRRQAIQTRRGAVSPD